MDIPKLLTVSQWSTRLTVGRIGVNLSNHINIPVDRTSPLGNPFRINNDHTRYEVIQMYKKFLYNEILNDVNDDIHNALEEIYDYLAEGYLVNLQCHCFPKECHADIIKNTIIGRLTANKVEL